MNEFFLSVRGKSGYFLFFQKKEKVIFRILELFWWSAN